MKLFQLIKLGHADFVAQRKVVTFSVLAASLPLIILIGLALTVTGLEQILIRASSPATDGQVVLALATAKDSAQVAQPVTEYGGQMVAEMSLAATVDFPTVSDYMAELAQVDRDKVAMGAGRQFVDSAQTEFHLLDLLLDGIYARYPDDYYYQALAQADESGSNLFLVKFPNPAAAYEYYQYVTEHGLRIGITEPFSNLLNIYQTFEHTLLKVTQTIFLIIIIIIIIATYVYLLDQNLHSMIIYRTLGGTTGDLLIISLTYLIEVGICIIITSLIGGMILALIFSGINAEYLTGLMANFYYQAPTSVLMLGFSPDILFFIMAVLAAAPISLLLMLDQFSINNMMKRLKHGQIMLQ